MANWTPEEDQILRDNAQHSARHIGVLLGKSRDAVIGRAHRIGITVGIKQQIIPVKTAAKGKDIRHPSQYTVTLRDVGEHQCRYTQEQGQDMRVCGLPVVKFGYCNECYNIVHIKTYSLGEGIASL